MIEILNDLVIANMLKTKPAQYIFSSPDVAVAISKPLRNRNFNT